MVKIVKILSILSPPWNKVIMKGGWCSLRFALRLARARPAQRSFCANPARRRIRAARVKTRVATPTLAAKPPGQCCRSIG